MPSMPLVIAFAEKYQPRIGLGTLLTLMLPYSVAFAIGWTALLALWLLLSIIIGSDLRNTSIRLHKVPEEVGLRCLAAPF